MTGRLQGAVKAVTAPPELAERIRAEVVAAGPPRQRWRMPLYYAAALAASIVLVVGAIGYRQGHFRFTEASREQHWAVKDSCYRYFRNVPRFIKLY